MYSTRNKIPYQSIVRHSSKYNYTLQFKVCHLSVFQPNWPSSGGLYFTTQNIFIPIIMPHWNVCITQGIEGEETKRNHLIADHMTNKTMKRPIYLLLNIKVIHKKNLKYNVLSFHSTNSVFTIRITM